MKIGIIGERYNYISYSMLRESIACKNVEIVWFVEAKLPTRKKEKLYGMTFDYGPIIVGLRKAVNFPNSLLSRTHIDCKILCDSKNIPYIVPKNLSINTGLPDKMYWNPNAEYALIAGCDQLLNENGLKIVKNKIINYHYAPLPAYRGKFVVFWQWYNREPYIGYSFHEVDLGVDSGKVIYQGKVDYNHDEPLHAVTRRVVLVSSEQLCKVYDCLANNTRVLLNENLQNSFFPSKKYLVLATADRSKRVDELLALFQRVGYFRLKNGLVIGKIIHSNYHCITDYRIDNEGIIIPLADGYIKGTISSRIPFWVLKALLGKRKILKGLS